MLNKEEKKIKTPLRWLSSEIYINYRSKKEIFNKSKKHKLNFGNYNFVLNESNMATIVMVCIGIEFFGRTMLGFRTEDSVSKLSFLSFIHYFFDSKYKMKERMIYKNYRSNLIHSYILGYRSSSGFFPTRGRRQFYKNHLERLRGTRRLIINIDNFVKDFQDATLNYLKQVHNKQIIKPVRLKMLKNNGFEEIDLRKNFYKSLKKIEPED